MQDKEYKNTFSEALIKGLLQAFDRIRTNPHYKVVIQTGYGPYFASGGTQEGLLAMADGQAKFADTNADANRYSLALDCPIPVIAAMAGHFRYIPAKRCWNTPTKSLKRWRKNHVNRW